MAELESNPKFGELSEAVIRINRKIAEAASLEAVLEALTVAAVALLPSSRACVLVLDSGSRSVRSLILRGFPEDHPRESTLDDLSEPVRRSLESGETVLSRAQPTADGEAGFSILAAPVRTENSVLGCLVLISPDGGTFGDADGRVLELLASQAAVALATTALRNNLLDRSSLDEELRIAREVQVSLQPAKAPDLEGCDLHGINIPSRAIGGDYFDFIPIVDGHVGIVVADVVGKGIPASLTMAGFRAFLHAEIRNNYAIRTIFAKVNNLLQEGLAPNQFVSAFYGVLDVTRRRLTYSNAGHNPPILLRPNGKRRLLVSGGPVLGIIRGSAYNERFIDLIPGDVLVLYTDGVVEAENPAGEMFGRERLRELVRANEALDAKSLCETVYREVLHFGNQSELADDTTVVVLKVLVPPEEPAIGS